METTESMSERFNRAVPPVLVIGTDYPARVPDEARIGRLELEEAFSKDLPVQLFDGSSWRELGSIGSQAGLLAFCIVRFEHEVDLRELIAEGGSYARDPGLLLAYAGFQLEDAAAVADGLKAMNTGVAAGAEPDQLSRLAELLGKVWTQTPEPAPQK